MLRIAPAVGGRSSSGVARIIMAQAAQRLLISRLLFLLLATGKTLTRVASSSPATPGTFWDGRNVSRGKSEWIKIHPKEGPRSD